MKPITVILFTIASIAVAMLLGDNYKALHISKTLWIIITGATVVAFVIKYIMDILRKE
jgi:flagellar motor component MotA